MPDRRVVDQPSNRDGRGWSDQWELVQWSTRTSPTSPDRITLTGSQRRELTRMTRAGRTEQRLVTRAQIVLAASAGESNAQIARWLGICEDTVRKWRRRWCAVPGAASLADAKRSGRDRPTCRAIPQRDHGAHPVHTSWLNQIEIYFSIVQRKVLSPNDFTDIDAVSDRLSVFETHSNQTAQPFKWKFTTTDLTELLARLDNHKPEPNHDPAQPRAA